MASDDFYFISTNLLPLHCIVTIFIAFTKLFQFPSVASVHTLNTFPRIKLEEKRNYQVIAEKAEMRYITTFWIICCRRRLRLDDESRVFSETSITYSHKHSLFNSSFLCDASHLIALLLPSVCRFEICVCPDELFWCGLHVRQALRRKTRPPLSRCKC